MKHDVAFIGEFPPPFNGVSVKDKLMYEQIFRDIGARMIDLAECKRKPWKIPAVFCHLVVAMIRSRKIVIGVGAISREKTLLTMRRILKGKKGMDGVIMIIMGGRYHELVRNDRYLRNLLTDVGNIWVEGQQMITDLQEQGLERVYCFPNFRVREGERPPRPRKSDEKLKLVFFSVICVEKGVDIIMKAHEIWSAAKAPVTLDFYGEVTDDIRERFLKFTGGYKMYTSMACLMR